MIVNISRHSCNRDGIVHRVKEIFDTDYIKMTRGMYECSTEIKRFIFVE